MHDRCALAPAPSVTLTAVATPFNGCALARNSEGSVETGGVSSVVTTKLPLERRDSRWLLVPDMAFLISQGFRMILPSTRPPSSSSWARLALEREIVSKMGGLILPSAS